MLVLLLFLASLTVGWCNEVGGDGCQESPWLCAKLALLSEQFQTIEQLNAKVSEQNVRLAHQQKLLEQIQEERMRDKAELNRLNEILDSLFTNSNSETGNTQNSPRVSRVLVGRSDDLGPLETVVNQLSQQVTVMSADIQALKNVEQQQNLNIQDARTSTFVHWGSSQCPSDSQLVYSGWVGGSLYSESGGGSNYLCLTSSPVLSDHGNPQYIAVLYGSEYQTFNSAESFDSDPVCAVCRSSHSTTIMIPGTNVCTQGWTQQYSGYLMAERQINSASEFICVDSAFESRPGSEADLNGRLLYFTFTHCGSLPCGPYVDNKMVTCVVCSK